MHGAKVKIVNHLLPSNAELKNITKCVTKFFEHEIQKKFYYGV
jgi:hypothetical protein